MKQTVISSKFGNTINFGRNMIGIQVFRMNRKKLAIFGVFLALMFIQASPVNAHTPSNIVVVYDFPTQELSVTVTHGVTDVNTHYIAQIVVEKNSVQVDSEAYTSQESTTGMSETFSISAVDGDTFRVTATCSISGNIVGMHVVSDPSATETTTTTTSPDTTTTPSNGGTPMDMTLTIAVVVVAIGVVAVVFVFIRRR
jgi:hypothetical protein